MASTNRPRGGENPLTTGVKQAVPYRTVREARYLSVSTEINKKKKNSVSVYVSVSVSVLSNSVLGLALNRRRAPLILVSSMLYRAERAPLRLRLLHVVFFS